jgi:TonB-linked SusC/RagA family outer membrane protein
MYPPGIKINETGFQLASVPASIHQLKIQNKHMKKNALKGSRKTGLTRLSFAQSNLIRLLFLTLLALPFSTFAQETKPLINSTLRGRVTDAVSKEALVGVSVFIKGTTHGVNTDKDGRFDFVTGQKFPYTLIVSYVGYLSKEVIVEGSPVEIQLQPSLQELDQVVITGYSTVNKKAYSGSVSQVKASQLENRPAQSFDQLLGGQAAGVDVVQPSGVLNNTPVFRVRGINSISSGIYPLILVDGVPLFTGLVGGTVGNNPLSNINTNDIESINILKDASATAIYGSRAANGVVVITTKKGKKGKAKVSFDSWVSASTARNLPPLLDAYDYTTIKNEAMVNAGKDPGYKLQTLSNGTVVNTNWYDVAFHRAYSNAQNLSVSGASDATNYYLSLAHTNQNGIVRTNNFKNSLIRLNLDHKLLDNVTIGVNFTYNNSVNSGPNTGSLPGQYLDGGALGRSTNVLPPNVAVYNEDGTYNIQDKSRMGYGANNADAASNGYIGTINTENLQLILDKDKYTSETNSAIANIYAQWTLFKGLDFKTSYGENRLVVENQRFQNPINGAAAPSGGLAANSNAKNFRSNWVNTLQYNTTIANAHHLNLLAGYEEIYTSGSSWGATRTGLTDNYFTSYQGSFTTISPSGNSQGENGFRSYFTNLNYDYKGRYLLSYSFRRDGYSGLAEGNKYGNFSGGSVGWNISEENFLKMQPFPIR